MVWRATTRTLAVLVLMVGLAVSALAFLAGAPVAVGAELGEPVESVCHDPWLTTHPGDHEPDLDATWSWWPPGVTCRRAGAEVFLEPTADDAAAVGGLGFAVLLLGVLPSVLLTLLLWRLGDRPAPT